MKIAHAWDEFWFAPRDLLGLAVQRILLCSTLLWMNLLRLQNLADFSDAGLIPRARVLDAIPEFYRPAFAWCVWPDDWNFAAILLLSLLLVLLIFGIGGRAIMWLAWILNMGFIQRNWAIGFGAETICSIFLFYMSFTQSCARLSVWKRAPAGDVLTSAMIRLMQIQLCVLYAFSGIHKLGGEAWRSGGALWEVLMNRQMVAFDMSFLRHAPGLVMGLTFAVVIFEVLFPLAMLNRRVRPWWLGAGVVMHAGTLLSMGLLSFFVAMLGNYFHFFDLKRDKN